MKFLSSLISLTVLCCALSAHSPPTLKDEHHFVPIRALLVSTPTQESVWIEGKVLSQEEKDIYWIEDSAAKICLFLCLDELLQYTILPGDHLAAWGKVDKSDISPEKNEFYVEKLFLKEKP
jgi:hypothetical protein